MTGYKVKKEKELPLSVLTFLPLPVSSCFPAGDFFLFFCFFSPFLLALTDRTVLLHPFFPLSPNSNNQRTYELEALLFRLRGLTESKRQGEEDDSDIEMVVTDDHLDITNAATASSPPSSPPLATTVTGVPSSSLVTSSPPHEETSKKYSTDSSLELMSPGSKKQIYVIVGNRELNRRLVNDTFNA